jgi:hypothetical protein
MSPAAGAVALLVAALLPLRFPRGAGAARGLAVLGALALLPSAGPSGAWPFVLLAAGAAALASPLPLVLAAAGAVVVALRPEASAPVAAAAAALAVAAAADGLNAWVRERRASGADPVGPALASGILLALLLAWVDRGAVLSWTFGIGPAEGRVVLPGVGVLLGVALVAALGGVLLVGGAKLAPEVAAVRPVGVGALWVAFGATTLGVGIALVEVSPLADEIGATAARPLAALVALAGALAATLLEASSAVTTDVGAESQHGRLSTRVAVPLALIATTAAGLEGWWRVGTYATALTAAAAGAALLGLAALEPATRLWGARRVAFLAALLYLLPV